MSMPRPVVWSLAPLLLSLGLPALADTCALQPDLAQATRTAFEQVQAGLDGQDEELPTDVSPAIAAAAEAHKDAITRALDARLACSGADLDADALQQEMARELMPAQPAPEGEETSVSPYAVARHDEPGLPPMVVVQAATSIPCGGDILLLGYAREGDRWVRTLEWRSPPLKELSDAYGDFYQYVRLTGGQFVIAHGTPWCTSRWSRLAVDVVQPRNGETAQRTLHHLQQGYVRDETEPRLKARPDGFELRAEVGSLDADRMTRAGIYRYRLDGDALQRIQPAASNGRGFVDEWLMVDDALAGDWSAPEQRQQNLTAREQLKAQRAEPGITLLYGPVRACKDAGRFQVEIQLYDSKKDLHDLAYAYATILQRPDGFTLMTLGDHEDTRCNGPDLMAGQ